jgi:hypothetical protein
MKIEYYNTINNVVNINFNKTFKQIKFVKMELLNENSNDSTMDSEEMEIKYTKNKSNINVFISSKNFITILIKEIDNVPVIYSYYLNKLNISTNCENPFNSTIQNEVLFSGLSSILKSQKLNEYTEKKLIDCQIKNENIFAKITKK